MVSKLAKSDRPLREKSPDKKVKDQALPNQEQLINMPGDHSSIDYRMTLNRRKANDALTGKFKRSISQPSTLPNTEFVLSSIVRQKDSKAWTYKEQIFY